MGLASVGCGAVSDPSDISYGGGGTARSFFASEPRATSASPEAPQETVTAMQSCADRLAPSLSPDHYAILFDVESTRDGNVTKVQIKDSMLGGSELEACLTGALKQMAVPASATRTQKKGVTPDSRGMVGVAQAAAAPIALVPILLVVGGVTILAVVTVSVASGSVTVDDVIDAARRRPKPNKNRCLNAAAGGGELWREFCRSISDKQVKESCWSLAERDNEEEKRNWCNEYLGFW